MTEPWRRSRPRDQRRPSGDRQRRPSAPGPRTTAIDVIASQLRAPSARELASTVVRLIGEQSLPPGIKLPPVRDLAQTLRISPATISAAWTMLRERGLIEGRGRAGTSIRAAPSPSARRTAEPARDCIDLRYILPDPDLLPSLELAFRHALNQPKLHLYDRAPMLPELRERVIESWPYRCDELLAVNGAADGIWLTLRKLTAPGDRILVEAPTCPRLAAIIRRLGLLPVALASDADGPTPDSVRRGLRTNPAVVAYQPRGQVPTGRVVSEARLHELSELLRRHRTAVLELDLVAELSSARSRSMGQFLPGQTTIVRTYENSHGPDLRLAAIGGTGSFVGAIHTDMLVERQWISRILQGALNWLLSDQRTCQLLDRARQEYQRRLHGLRRALSVNGIHVDAVDGLCLTIPVEDETTATHAAKTRGVLVATGADSLPGHAGPFVRISVSQLTGDYDDLAHRLGQIGVRV